jgi:hypothetical protein
MKFLLKVLYILLYIFLFSVSLKCQGLGGESSDPFKSLGIPDLNPQRMLEELDLNKNQKKRINEEIKLKSIADVPKFLKYSNITQEEAIDTVSKFLLQDDSYLKTLGVIYDQTGFEGLKKGTKIANYGTEERLIQRVKSSAFIWVKKIKLK